MIFHPDFLKSRRPAAGAVLCGLLASCLCALFPGCERQPRGAIPERVYASDATFTAVFPPAFEGGSPVVCAGVKTGDHFTLTVLSPERSAGVRIEADPSVPACSLFTDTPRVEGASVPDDPIPVDPAAAEALLSPLAVLCGLNGTPDSDLLTPALARSPDGEETLVAASGCILALSPDGVPLRVTSPDFAGVPREIVLSSWEYAE